MNLEKVMERSIVDKARLKQLAIYLFDTYHVPGDMAEVGVYKGGTALLMSGFLKTGQELYVFDTFTGIPDPDPNVDFHKKGDFADTNASDVMYFFEANSRRMPFIISGIFPDSAGLYVSERKFSIVHLDCDIYKSVKDSLEFFWDRMNPGGIIVIDDYGADDCLGAKKAVDEFCSQHSLTPQNPTLSQVALFK